jgi:hypothetical protein
VTHVAALKRAFTGADRHAAHRLAAPALAAMARDRGVLHAVARNGLRDPAFLQKTRSHALVTLDIEENPDFTLVANCFLPLPDRAPDISSECIHHHGNLLLTTVAAFGDGYESLVFKRGFATDERTGETRMQVEKVYTNELYNVEFIDARTPHVVFFPRRLAITYALWSADRRIPFARLRRSPILQRVKRPVIAVIKAIGASRAMAVNVVEDLDFSVEGNRIYALHERLYGYANGTNANFVQNVFHILQQIGFDDRPFLEQLRARCADTAPDAVRWIDALLAGQPIADVFEPGHLNIEKINLKKQDIMAAAC